MGKTGGSLSDFGKENMATYAFKGHTSSYDSYGASYANPQRTRRHIVSLGSRRRWLERGRYTDRQLLAVRRYQDFGGKGASNDDA